MNILTITMLHCVSAATGVDAEVNQAIAALAPSLSSAELEFDPSGTIQGAVDAVPGLLEAIDRARQDPDDLYVTTDTRGGLDNAIWPGRSASYPTQAGQSQRAEISVFFEDNVNVSLWDYDSASDDDLLGSITALASEAGLGQIAKLASNPAEGSAYYVVYRVD